MTDIYEQPIAVVAIPSFPRGEGISLWAQAGSEGQNALRGNTHRRQLLSVSGGYDRQSEDPVRQKLDSGPQVGYIKSMEAKEGFDWRWFAGFFDGEGCIYISHLRPANGYQLNISIAQKVRSPLQYINDHLGGRIRNDDGYYRWTRNGLPAKEILAEIEPLLRVKRGEANIALWYPVNLHKDQLHDKQTGRILPDPPLKKLLQRACWDAFRVLRGRKELPSYE